MHQKDGVLREGEDGKQIYPGPTAFLFLVLALLWQVPIGAVILVTTSRLLIMVPLLAVGKQKRNGEVAEAIIIAPTFISAGSLPAFGEAI